jgi:LysM repeat protein
MSQSDNVVPAYGRERVCPHCGTRVAQKANTCFFCGGVLDVLPRRRRLVPWADIVLFVFIGALLVFWWLNAPAGHNGQQIAQLATSPVSGVVRSTVPGPTLTPQALVPVVLSSSTPMPRATDTPEPTQTLTLVPTPIRHKVEAGESLGLIADTYGSTAKDIADANGLSADAMIHPGDELIVPVAGPSGGPGPTATPSGGTLIYSVQPGDTISEIADRFGSQIDWILDANKRKATDMLRPGDRLLVPLSNRTPTPTHIPDPTAIPTPSITPEPMLRSPILLSPADGSSVVAESEVLLRWASSGVLAKDQWYVVMVKVVGSSTPVAPYWTKGTVWRLPSDYREPGKDATQFSWQVQVFVGAPGQANPKPASPPSEARTFTWTK